MIRPSPRPFVRGFGLLVLLAAIDLRSGSIVAESGPRPQASPAAGVLATVRGEVTIQREGGARPLAGAVGMRLMPGDGLRVGAASSATVYLAGGSIVRVPAGGRIEI